MINYDTIANITGAFPNVAALNTTGPTTTDGTPYIKAFIDDLWGFSQALMNHAGLTPDAVTESASASQRLAALQNVTIGPGCVVAWHGDDADPATIGRRMLPLNGQGVLVASYVDLDLATYVGVIKNPTASAYYRADDAAGTIRNASGVYLILPDLRGYAIRGLDTSGTVDPDGPTRDIGSVQEWAITTHEHYVWDSVNEYIGAVVAIDWDLTTPDKFAIEMTSSVVETDTEIMADSMTTASVPALNQSGESRMSNNAARWVIVY